MFVQEPGNRAGGDFETGSRIEGQAGQADLRKCCCGRQWLHQLIQQRRPGRATTAVQAETYVKDETDLRTPAFSTDGRGECSNACKRQPVGSTRTN
ncbi:MAG: hypothetical protein ACK559_38150, partial [bacterium]